MTRLPQVTARELVRFLKVQGFAEDRQSGSHLTLWHAERNVSVTIPVHTGCDLGRGLAVRILKDAGFSVEEYLRLR
jgi:predicted RNA binding protein YcfA (HicA-like mRNA interferase family)